MTTPVDYGAFFAHESGAEFTDGVAQLTGRTGGQHFAGQRSSPHLFEFEVAAKPKRAVEIQPYIAEDDDDDEDYVEVREPWLTN